MNTTAAITSEQVITKNLVGEALTINNVTIAGIETDNPPQVADKLVTRSVLNTSLASINKALNQLDPEGDLFQDLSVISLSLVDTYFARNTDWVMNNWAIVDSYMYYNSGSSANSLKIHSSILTNPGHYVCIIDVGALTSGKVEVRLNNEWVATLKEEKEYIIELTITNPATDVIELVAVNVSSASTVRLDAFGFHYLTNRFYKYLISKVSSMTELNPDNYVTIDSYEHQQEILAAQFRALVTRCMSELTAHKTAINPHNITPELIGAATFDHVHSEYVTTNNIESALRDLLVGYSKVGHTHSEYLTINSAHAYIDTSLATALESIKVVDPFIITNAPQAALPSRYAQTDVTPAVAILVPSSQANDSNGSLDYYSSMITTNRKELMSQISNVFSIDSTKRAIIPVDLLDSVVNFRITFNHTRKVKGYIVHCYGTNKFIDWKVVTGNTTFIHRITNPTNYELSGNDNKCEINFDRVRDIDSLSFMFMGPYTGDDVEIKLHIELIYVDLLEDSFGITNKSFSVCLPDNGANKVIIVPAKAELVNNMMPEHVVSDIPVYVYINEQDNAIWYSLSYYPVEVANTRRGINVFLDKFANVNKSAIDPVETYRHSAYGDLSLVKGTSAEDSLLNSIYSSSIDSWYSDGSTNQVTIKQTILSNDVLLKGYMLNWRNTDIDNIPDTWTLTIDGLDENDNPTTVVFDSVEQYYPFYSVEDDDIVYHCKFDSPIRVKAITLTMSAITARPIALNKLFLYLSEYYYAISENTMYLGNIKHKAICLGTAEYVNGKWKVYNACIGRSCVIPINNLDMTEPYTEYTIRNPFHTVDIVASVQNYVLTDDETINSPDAYVSNITSEYITVYTNTTFRYALSISRTW